METDTGSRPGPSLALIIAEDLKKQIYAGEIRPGERLNEAALASRIGTSRAPIREAIRILAGTGLVTSVSNRGFFVREVTVKEMLEIYDVRALIFGYAAQRASERLTDQQRRLLEDLLSRMDSAAAVEDSDLYYRLNLEFHERIVALANNQRAQRIYDECVKDLHLFRRRNFESPAKMRISNLEHRKIFDAIARSDKARARQAAETHIQAGRLRLLDMLDYRD